MRNVLVAIVIGIILALGIWISFQLRDRDAQPPEIEVVEGPAQLVTEVITVADYAIRIQPNRNRQARIEYEVAQANQPDPTATPLPLQSAETPSPEPQPPTNTPPPQAVVPTNTPVPPPVTSDTFCNNIPTTAHTVSAGETLYGLAQRYGTSVMQMAECDIAIGDMIPGNVIYVPTGVGENLGGGSTGNTTCTANSAIHIVAQGENVFRIGLRYGVDKDAIRIANNLNANYLIYPGDRLCIP